MSVSVNIFNNEIGSTFSGDLQEIFTDFDVWIRKWSLKFKQRSDSPKHFESQDNGPQKKCDYKQALVLEDLLVYGFASGKMADFKNLIVKLEIIEDCVIIDNLIMKLLNGNSRRTLLFNSKL